MWYTETILYGSRGKMKEKKSLLFINFRSAFSNITSHLIIGWDTFLILYQRCFHRSQVTRFTVLKTDCLYEEVWTRQITCRTSNSYDSFHSSLPKVVKLYLFYHLHSAPRETVIVELLLQHQFLQENFQLFAYN